MINSQSAEMAGSSRELRDRYSRMSMIALVVGVIGIVGLVAGWILDTDDFYQSYIFGYAYWMTITLGMIAWGLLHNMTAGKWGFTIRRMLQAGSFNDSFLLSPIVLMAVMFVPIIIGSGYYYEWMHPEVVANDHVLELKSFYLNEPFWYGRLIFYFVFWIGISYWLKRLLDREEQTYSIHDSKLRTIQRISGFGLVVFLLSVNFSMTDWLMSLEPHWFSTIYGVIMLIGGVLSAIALSNTMVVTSARYRPFSGYLETKTLHDLGNLMFALTIFWAYVSFSQYIIIWSANLAEEAGWYLKRIDGVYEVIGYFLLAFHFIFPFLVLIQRKMKRNPFTLKRMAFYILIVHFVDLFWQIKPAFQEVGDTSFNIHILDFAAVAGIGGIWLFMYLRSLATSKRPLLPPHDLRMKWAKPVVEEVPATVQAR